VDYGWRRRRLAAVLAGIVVLGGMFAVTQFASAEDDKAAACEAAVKAQREESTEQQQQQQQSWDQQKPPAEQPPGDVPPPEQPPAEQPPAEQPPAEQPPAEQPAPPQEQPPAEQPPPPTEQPTPTDEVTPPQEPEQPAPPECEDVPPEDQPAPPPNNGLDVIARDCGKTKLEEHKGFQDAPRCVTTEMGEVSAADRNPTLLITSAPRFVRVNRPFEIKFSSRNLVRDRFLAAGVGGYYLETSVLTDEGLQRGHVHVSCRMLSSRRNAPQPDPVPAFFKAIEDSKGGSQPDTVTVQIPGLPSTGTAQCAAWAGDNTHRIPMMQRANQQPAFDVVRVNVTR
jgi:hypothetical protein